MYRDQRVTVMIPALDEEDCIGDVVRSIPKDAVDEVVVIDNGSSDSTADVARAAGATVLHESTMGYGHALMRGLSQTRTGIVVFMDGDGADDPRDLARLLEPIGRGADLVIGVRAPELSQASSTTWPQRMGNRLVLGLVDLLFGRQFADLGPFRAIRVDAFHRLPMRHLTYGWTVEMQVKALTRGLRVEEVPVHHRKRSAGRSKVSGNLRAVAMAGVVMPTSVLKMAWEERTVNQRTNRPNRSTR